MRLEFDGKQHIYGHHLTVPISPLIPDYDKSIAGADGESDDENLIIHGDNLYALKSLLPKYAGRVKCIYIDPPYNTGNEGLKYTDRVNSPRHRAWFQKEVGKDADDLERHDKWLSIMWPRLHLLRELLRDDGAIFVSIDDNEVHHLRMLMNEIFGEDNFISQIVWHSKYTQANDARFISRQHEYLLLFAKDKHSLSRLRIARPESMNKRYSNPNNDPRGPWKPSPLHAKSGSGNYEYTFSNGYTWQAPPGTFPRYSLETLRELENDNRITFGRRTDNIPSAKTFLNELGTGVVSGSLWHYSDVGHTHSANERLASLLGKGAFDNPKSVGLIERACDLLTDSQEHDIVLDSFAGSGTTADAVITLNHRDGGNRRFILVECEDYADTVTAERVRCVIQGVPDAQTQELREGLGGSFTYCTLGDPLNVSKMLSGESLPSYRDMAVFMYYTATGRAIDPASVDISGSRPFYREREREFWLFYRPDIEWLKGSDSTFTESLAERVAQSGSKTVVFAPHKYMPQRHLSEMGITFCQLPYAEPV